MPQRSADDEAVAPARPARRGLVSPELVLFGTGRNVGATEVPRFQSQPPAGWRLKINHAPGMTVVVPEAWPSDSRLDSLAQFCGSAVRQPLDMVVLVLPPSFQPSDDEAAGYWDRYAVIVASEGSGTLLERAEAILAEHREQGRVRAESSGDEAAS